MISVKKNLRKPSAALAVILSVLMLLSVFPAISFAAYSTEYYYASGTQFVSEIAFARSGYWSGTVLSGTKSKLSDKGYETWDKDFNDGCGTNSDYIAGGWKYTTDISRALRDVKFWVSDSGSVPQYYDLTVNGRNVRYYLVGGTYEANNVSDGGVVDLNGGAGGKYIYAFITRDPAAGPPITYIKVNTNNADSGYWSCTSLQSTSSRIDLNSGAKGDYIFMHLTSTATEVNSKNLRSVYASATNMIAKKSNYTVDSARALENAYNNAKPVIESLDTYGASINNQAALNALYTELNTAVNNATTNVYFNASNNGGTTAAKSTTVKIGSASSVVFDVSSYTATKANAEFLGWSTDKNATAGAKTTVNVGFNNTLYAVFSMDVAATFKYLGEDGTIVTETKNDKLYNIASSTTIETPDAGNVTYNGKELTFLGWRDDNIANVALYTDSVKVQPGINKTFRAVYSAPVTLAFDANGGETEAPEALTATKYFNVNDTVTERGVSFVLPEDILQKSGFGFLGWAEKANATKAKYHTGAEITGIKEDLTLYAVWSEDYYTVTFKNYDGTVLYETNVVYNETPVYAGETPEKVGTVESKWVFDGWDNEIVPATGNVEYVATFRSEIADYSVKFINPDGEVLQETMVNYGETPSYAGATPELAPTQQYTYIFRDWNKDFVPVDGPQIYIALYDEYLNSYNVQFVNYDGEVLHQGLMEYGAVPVYNGDAPEKASDDQYDYTFKGWDKELAAIEGNTVYTAVYKSTVRSYDIKFVNYDGTELYTASVKYGAIPKYKSTVPARESDFRYTYSFIGWEPEIVPVTGEATYTALFQGTEKMMIVTFFNFDGNVLESKFIKYDTTPEYTGATPTKPANAQYTYTFKGWDRDLENITENTEYRAQFEEILNEYTVKFVNYDGTVLQEEILAYGSEVAYNGVNPEKPTDAYIYSFKGWDKEIAAVTGDVTYTAVFDKLDAAYTIKFLDEDGTVLQEKFYSYGDTPVCEAPSKACDSANHYTFKGWNKEIAKVTQNTTYVAVYEAIAHNYVANVDSVPSCTEDGKTTYTCECGDTYVMTALATGHKYEYVVDGEAVSKVCSVCGDTIEVTDEAEKEEVLGGTTDTDGDVCEFCGKYHYKYLLPGIGRLSCFISRIFTFLADLFAGKSL